MRKLGDQWIEVVDGKNHMVKAVELLSIYDGKSINGRTCHGCSFVDEWDDDCTLKNPPCRISEHKAGPFIIKDLGVLNEEGLLPCPFCGEYPLVENAYEGVSGHNTPDGFWRISCFGENHEMAFFSGKTRQQAIDAWNRRA